MGIFFISLWLPCYCLPNDECYDGWYALCFGWLAFLGTVGIGWVANPLLFIAWIINKRSPLLSVIFGSIAFGVAASVPFLTAVNGIRGELANYKAGYWVWLASYFVMLAGNIPDFVLIKKLTSKYDTQP
jgi:hypothetical protein